MQNCCSGSITCPRTCNTGNAANCAAWPVCADTSACNDGCSCANSWCGCTGQCGCTCSACQQSAGCGNANCNANCNTSCNTSCNGNCGGSAWGSPAGYLLPRVYGIGRFCQRNLSTELCVADLPDCAEGCFTLLSVSACDQPTWDILPGEGSRPTMVRVTIPLSLQVRDGSCTVRTGHTVLVLEVPLRVNLPSQDMWRGSLLIVPCVRMVSSPCPSATACFDVVLEVLVDVYMVRWEPSWQSGANCTAAWADSGSTGTASRLCRGCR